MNADETVAGLSAHRDAPEVFGEGFDVQVLVDRPVYAPGQVVRITVSATNHRELRVEQRVPGWRCFALSIVDERFRTVAEDGDQPGDETPAVMRWLPGQTVIWPIYWHQQQGPIVPGWSRLASGHDVDAGRYRVRLRWLARPSSSIGLPPEFDSPWFDIVRAI